MGRQRVAAPKDWATCSNSLGPKVAKQAQSGKRKYCTVFKAVRMVPYPSGMSYLTPQAIYMARPRSEVTAISDALRGAARSTYCRRRLMAAGTKESFTVLLTRLERVLNHALGSSPMRRESCMGAHSQAATTALAHATR